jgi:polygalacturonase
MTFSRLLLVDGAERVRIEGRGTIAGSGRVLRTVHGAVPNLIRVRSSGGVAIQDVLLRDAAAWTVHILASRDVAVGNVKILNDRGVLNTDGVDIDMSSGVRVDRAFVSTKDDAVCVKATRNGGLAGDVRDVRVTRCVVSSRDAALKIGSETDADRIADIAFEDCWVFDSGRAMSVVVRDGATVERVAFRRIGIGPRVDHLVEQVIGVRDPEARYGTVRDLAFEDVSAPEYEPPASAWTWYAQFRPGRPADGSDVSVFEGADESHAVEGLRLRNVAVRGRRLTSAAEAREVAGLTIGDHVRNMEIE